MGENARRPQQSPIASDCKINEEIDEDVDDDGVEEGEEEAWFGPGSERCVHRCWRRKKSVCLGVEMGRGDDDDACSAVWCIGRAAVCRMDGRSGRVRGTRSNATASALAECRLVGGDGLVGFGLLRGVRLVIRRIRRWFGRHCDGEAGMVVEVKKPRLMMPRMNVMFGERGEAELNHGGERQSQAVKDAGFTRRAVAAFGSATRHSRTAISGSAEGPTFLKIDLTKAQKAHGGLYLLHRLDEHRI